MAIKADAQFVFVGKDFVAEGMEGLRPPEFLKMQLRWFSGRS